MAEAADLDTLASVLRGLDERVRVEVVDPALLDPPRHGCDVCAQLECAGTAHVSWWSDGANRTAWAAPDHLPGWVSGFVIPDSDDEDICVELTYPMESAA